jgi:hypothetical protein
MPSKSKSAICVENLVVRTARDEHLLNDDGSTFLGHGTADLVFPTALPGSRPSIVTLKDFRIKVTPDGDFALWPATRKYVVNGVEKSAVTYWLDDGTYAVLLQGRFPGGALPSLSLVDVGTSCTFVIVPCAAVDICSP